MSKKEFENYKDLVDEWRTSAANFEAAIADGTEPGRFTFEILERVRTLRVCASDLNCLILKLQCDNMFGVEVNKCMNNPDFLYHVIHHHRHGESHHYFRLTHGSILTEENCIKYIEDYETDRGDWIEILPVAFSHI